MVNWIQFQWHRGVWNLHWKVLPRSTHTWVVSWGGYCKIFFSRLQLCWGSLKDASKLNLSMIKTLIDNSLKISRKIRMFVHQLLNFCSHWLIKASPANPSALNTSFPSQRGLLSRQAWLWRMLRHLFRRISNFPCYARYPILCNRVLPFFPTPSYLDHPFRERSAAWANSPTTQRLLCG